MLNSALDGEGSHFIFLFLRKHCMLSSFDNLLADLKRLRKSYEDVYFRIKSKRAKHPLNN